MTDGTGTTQYACVAVGALSALRLQQETGPLAASTIAYAFDALGLRSVFNSIGQTLIKYRLGGP